MRISSDDRSLELPPSAWFSSSAEKYFFHFVIRAKPSCIPRAKPKCAPRAEPKCAPRAEPKCAPRAEPNAPRAKPNAPRAKPNAPRAKPNAPRAKPRGGTVHRSSRLGFARRTVFERSRGACYISRIRPVVLKYFSASR